jgi:hypothetical protein
MYDQLNAYQKASNRNSQASIVEIRNKHGNGDEFPDFADLFFFGIKMLGSVSRSIGNTILTYRP